MFKKIMAALLGVFLIVPYGFAVLHLELTQGVDSAVPIAIVKFGGSSSVVNELNDVMKQDFTNTGRFRAIDTSSLQQPTSANAVDVKFWQNQGVNNVVVGQVTPVSGGRYNVTFALLDVFKTDHKIKPIPGAKGLQPQAAVSSPVLTQQTFTNVPANQMRTLAHHIDDLIYLQLTGMKGIFSTKIAYVLVKKDYLGKKRYSLEISDYDGNDPRAILNSPQPIMSPAWAPDARHIAYVSFENSLSAIYMTDIVTGKRYLISDLPGVNGAPAFSPDGSQLALVLTKTDQLKVYVMNIKTKQTTRITDGYAIDTEPSFAPDGKSIIFTSDRAGGPQIYQINLINHAVTRLTFDGDYNARASFTPDGKQIVLLHRDSGGPYSIAVMDLETGVLRMLVQGDDVQSPSVAPNGSMIIYSNRDNGQGILAEVSTDGKVQLRLPARDGDVREPAWSPFWNK